MQISDLDLLRGEDRQRFAKTLDKYILRSPIDRNLKEFMLEYTSLWLQKKKKIDDILFVFKGFQFIPNIYDVIKEARVSRIKEIMSLCKLINFELKKVK